MDPKEYTVRCLFVSLCIFIRDQFPHCNDEERNNLMELHLNNMLRGFKEEEREILEKVMAEAAHQIDVVNVFDQVGWKK